MAKKMKSIKTIYTDHLLEDMRGWYMPLYMSRICKVVKIDTGVVYKLKPSDKEVYGYLCGIGYSCGYNSIYPTISQMMWQLGLTNKTIINSIKLLNDVGLVKTSKHKKDGKWDNNTYKVLRPNMIPRTQWLDLYGNILKGKHYDFNPKQFQKGVDELKKDKLLCSHVEKD